MRTPQANRRETCRIVYSIWRLCVESLHLLRRSVPVGRCGVTVGRGEVPLGRSGVSLGNSNDPRLELKHVYYGVKLWKWFSGLRTAGPPI